MKVRKLNRKPGKSKSKQRWLQSIKRWNLKFFNKLMLSLLFLQILAASHWLCFCQGLSRNFWISYLGTFKFLLIFYKINKFVISLFETCLWSQHFYFITRNSRMCSSYHSGLVKMSIIRKIWDFHPRLKFLLGLAQPSWNFSSSYWVEIFACNRNVILKRRLLLYTNFKFQHGLKTSI